MACQYDPQITGKSVSTVKGFIIHLKRAHERKAHVDTLLNSLPVPTDIIDAVDGQCLTEAELARYYVKYLHKPHYPFRLGINEAACFLSHRKAWQAIIDQDLDAGFIIEDDVAIDAHFEQTFSAAMASCTIDDFIRFPFRANREVGDEQYVNDALRIIRPVPIGLGMVAQLVGKEAAKKLLAITEQFDRPVDTFIQMQWVTGLQPLSILPGAVTEISRSLGGTTIQHQKTLFNRLHREIMRPLYRLQVVRYANKHRIKN